jgi:chromosome partitioning protein
LLIRRQIAFINEKGGSCKTTLASNVGDYLARHCDKRVLLVDLDPQGQLGKVLGIDVGGSRLTALDMLLDAVLGEDTRPALPIVKARHPRLDLVPSNKSLALFPEEVAGHGGEEYYYLRHALEQAGDYDFIIFDAPPSFGPITLNVLLAANEIVVPAPLTYLALDGVAEITRTVEMVRTRFNHPELKITQVVPTFARRTKMAAEILEKLRQHFPKQVSKEVMGYSVLIDQAQSRAKTIFEYAPRSTAARWIRNVAEELLAREPA